MNLLNHIFPYYKGANHEDLLRAGKEIAQVDHASWRNDPTTFLEEAKRLQNMEEDRKRVAEAKIYIYMTFLIAVMSVVFSQMELGGIKEKIESVIEAGSFTMLSVMVLLLAIIYGFAAFHSSFCALKIRLYSYVGVDKFLEASKKDAPKEYFIKEILKAINENEVVNNDKVAYIEVTEGRIFRMILLMFLSFILYVAPDVLMALK